MPSKEQTKWLLANQHEFKGPLWMVNLLRFHDLAQYPTNFPAVPSSPTPLTGRAAYHHYMRLASPLVEKMGVELRFEADCHHVMIGPAGERWDAFLLVRYPSISAFLTLTTDPEYRTIVKHRAAALRDSRLVLMTHAESEITSIASVTQTATAKL